MLRGSRVARACAWPIPVRPVARRLAVGRALLVGDAAGFGEAFFGEGVFNAVRSADMAYEALRAALEEGARPRNPTTRAPRRSGGNSSSRDSWRGSSMPRRSSATSHLVRNRSVNELFSRLIAGGASPMRCFLETLFLCPLWVFRPHAELGAENPSSAIIARPLR